MHRVLLLPAVCLCAFLAGCILLTGCADGPLPEARYLNPWTRKQWDDDEAVATTYHKKVADLAALRAQAARLPADQLEPIAVQLAARLQEEKAPALRSELVRTLGEFQTPAGRTAVATALADESAIVRIAACKAVGRHPAPESVEALAHAVASDTDLDVRIAATNAMGQFSDAALPTPDRKRLAQSLRPALDDRDPALQTAAMQSLTTITGRDNFRNSVTTWREYLDGANPAAPPPPTIAETLQRSLKWY